MRKTTLLVGILAGVAVSLLAVMGSGGGTASADNGPHVAGAGVTADTCAACHRTHTALGAKLLKAAQPGLCYTCHGTGGLGADTAVQEGKLYTPPGPPYTPARTVFSALRGGGFDFALINSVDATANTVGALTVAAATTSWHTNNGAAGTQWGNGAIGSGAGTANSISCGSCHDPHGNGKFRILRSIPTGSGAALGVDVTDQVAPKVYNTTNFFDVTYVNNTQISSWCAQCHTRYLAAAGSATTTSGDAIFTFRHASDGNGVPACVKCHAGHGTNAAVTAGGNSAGLTWPDGTAGSGLNNTRLLKMDNRGICQKCHNK